MEIAAEKLRHYLKRLSISLRKSCPICAFEYWPFGNINRKFCASLSRASIPGYAIKQAAYINRQRLNDTGNKWGSFFNRQTTKFRRADTGYTGTVVKEVNYRQQL